MEYQKIFSGYLITGAVHGSEAANLIKQLLDAQGGRGPLRFDFDCAGEGFADGIGMTLSNRYAINNVEFSINPVTRGLTVFIQG